MLISPLVIGVSSFLLVAFVWITGIVIVVNKMLRRNLAEGRAIEDSLCDDLKHAKEELTTSATVLRLSETALENMRLKWEKSSANEKAFSDVVRATIEEKKEADTRCTEARLARAKLQARVNRWYDSSVEHPDNIFGEIFQEKTADEAEQLRNKLDPDPRKAPEGELTGGF